ncbi:MAG: hypothetical protein P4L74_02870 [Candidatus Doudnabacteria bacterium]|nr:hypothetical protein [Candidatus Doudnabacteria bacterium]
MPNFYRSMVERFGGKTPLSPEAEYVLQAFETAYKTAAGDLEVSKLRRDGLNKKIAENSKKVPLDYHLQDADKQKLTELENEISEQLRVALAAAQKYVAELKKAGRNAGAVELKINKMFSELKARQEKVGGLLRGLGVTTMQMDGWAKESSESGSSVEEKMHGERVEKAKSEWLKNQKVLSGGD